ncbi:MAG: type II toxin-antitoxin system HipA family toxin [Acidobacteria bacterium]|nr:type II toxin-antitoxin system HipA family toxin [Acidobacteriota bacterium]
MDREVLVFVDLQGTPVSVGRLWWRSRGGRESASFEYDAAWLEHPERFALEPALALTPGPFHTPAGRALFGALGDSTPDRWGRLLMRRAERRGAEREQRAPRTLSEVDVLLRVDDEARQGALRFATRPGGPFLAESGDGRIPPLVELPRLLAAADRVSGDTEGDEDLRLLLGPGSSLGGARPKAAVRDTGGRLALAKFAHVRDEVNVVLWEAVALALAERCGIIVPARRLERVAGRPVLVLQRFDRRGDHRVPFLSAMSMLGAADREPRSYPDIADALRRHGAAPREDLRQLWRRVVFSVLISNTDDHLRNHGFLYADHRGWRLSPAYDLNPVPADVRPRVLSTSIHADDPAASLDLALQTAELYGLGAGEARLIASEVAAAVTTWRDAARSLGASRRDIDRMASAFEHPDADAARRLQA